MRREERRMVVALWGFAVVVLGVLALAGYGLYRLLMG
jgi:hypothetical protein